MTHLKEPIYLVDDEENVLLSLKSGLEKEGYLVRTFSSAVDMLKSLKSEPPAVVVTDILMPDLDGIELIQKSKRILPDLSFIVMTAHASIDSAIQALRLGVIDYLVKPFRMNELIATIQKATSQTRLIPVSGEKSGLEDRYRFKNLITKDPKMIETFNMVSKIAKTDTTILIMGESGTGKEMMARSIHYNSKRKGNSFVSVNCAALPETLLESELFGYEKGAFTGAVASKPGLFEIADAGTFFLDEVGEIPMSLQAKLLRVLQERVIVHLGGIREVPINIRLIAATSKNLPKEAKEGRFREDLFYRLHVVPIVMSPLRERQNDIPLFAEHFLKFYSDRHGNKKSYRIDETGMAFLKNCEWPGNIREFENLFERIVTLHEEETITASTLEHLLGGPEFSSKQEKSMEKRDEGDLHDAVEELEKRMIEEALKKADGNKFKAARELGVTRQNLRYKLKKYNIH